MKKGVKRDRFSLNLPHPAVTRHLSERSSSESSPLLSYILIRSSSRLEVHAAVDRQADAGDEAPLGRA